MITDSLENFKPLGWSGGGHFHLYTDDDPDGSIYCPRCHPENEYMGEWILPEDDE